MPRNPISYRTLLVCGVLAFACRLRRPTTERVTKASPSRPGRGRRRMRSRTWNSPTITS